MSKRLSLKLLAGAGALAITALGLLSSATVHAQQKLKWAHVYETSEPYHKWSVWAAEEIKKRSNGKFDIQVFPASTLGKETDINQGLTLGTVDMIISGTSFAARAYPRLGIAYYPFIFRDGDHLIAYSKSAVFQDMVNEFRAKTGIQVKMKPVIVSEENTARPITEVPADGELTHWASGINEFDRVLGGGIVPGAAILLSGEPGVGKSTLLLEVASRAAKTGARVLYVSAEESVSQVRLRASRTGALTDNLYLAAETDLSTIIGQIDAVGVAQGLACGGPRLHEGVLVFGFAGFVEFFAHQFGRPFVAVAHFSEHRLQLLMLRLAGQPLGEPRGALNGCGRRESTASEGVKGGQVVFGGMGFRRSSHGSGSWSN